MLLLIIFAFLGGFVTIASPCILPILPIVLSGSLTGSKKRPMGIVTGFIISFTFFTLFLTAIIKATGLSADVLRNISVVIVFLFGVSLLLPKFQEATERLFSKLAGLIPNQNNPTNSKSDFLAGILIGISLGLVWTPCVGPILASIITIAATSAVTMDAVLITFSYATGTAIPLLAITYGGRQLIQKVPALVTNTGKIQKAFGVLMILTALAIYFQFDRKFQSYILDRFPNYGVGLTKLEDTQTVRNELQKLKSPKPSPVDVAEPNLGKAPDFILGGQWFNSKPLMIKDLKGKVVLIDFWTYTCINCIRTLPYLKTWYSRYHDKGLVIIGVHTPEFEFEKNADNLARAIKDFGLTYPIMQDNNYATWNAYNNQYWPAKYLIDKDGNIRWTHFGEGGYDEAEQMIQTLLKETGASITMPIENPQYSVNNLTPETYLGYRRMAGASPQRPVIEKAALYTEPTQIGDNEFAFSGIWTVMEEYSMPDKNAELFFHFNAQRVFLVMRPKNSSLPGRIRVSLDNQIVDTNNAGEDVEKGIVNVSVDKLYKLISLPTAENKMLKLEFLDDNVELYAFTFG